MDRMPKTAAMDRRYLAVATAGASAFIDMYATQPLLPELRVAFGATEAAVGATISALTLACALAAPFVGSLADRIGRKRVIVTAIALLGLVTLGTAGAKTLSELIAWRFAQGLFMPAVFAVTLAYIAEEFPAEVGGRAVGAYVGGNVFGGFFGRYLTALIADRTDWHVAFVVLGALNLAGAAVVGAALPRSTRFVRSASLFSSLRAAGGFLRNPVLLTADFVGAAILFCLVAAFTYATFYLAAPPFRLGTAALGNVFCVYLVGVVATPLAGRLIDRLGHRAALIVACGVNAFGIAVTLVPNVVAVVAGLAVMATGTFAASSASQGYIGVVASAQRSTAAALYLSCYYVGGGIGAVLPAVVWGRGGWPATVAMIVMVQAAAALAAAKIWPRARASAERRRPDTVR